MPSKRIRSTSPNVSGGGGGATTLLVPTARWSEDVSADDSFASGLVASPEPAQVDDALSLLIAQQLEDVTLDDAWVHFGAPVYSDDAQVNDKVVMTMLDVDVSRTGTPDNDLMFDAYTNQTAATAGTNFGNADLLVRGPASIGNANERKAYLAIDFTGMTGFGQNNQLNGFTSAFGLTIQFSNSNGLVAATLNVNFRAVASKPFTESTITWNNSTALATTGTSVASTTRSVPAGGGFSASTFFLTASNMSNIWGNWMLVVFSMAGAAIPDTVTIRSRDNATASNRPKFSWSAQRGT